MTLVRLKGRQEDKPFLTLIGNKDVSRFSRSKLPLELQDFWPGPLTIILPTFDGDTIALRMPDDNFLLQLLNHVQYPLYSTSANRSGESYVGDVGVLIEMFETEVACIVSAGNLPTIPSTILDASTRPYRILRQGACRIPENVLE